MNTIYFVFLVTVIATVSAAYNDYRCKCICNLPNNSKNISTLSKKVYIQSVELENCRCPFMMPDLDAKWCPRCECKYQSRKTKIIEVVVWIVISSIFGLSCYMFVLQLIDMFCKKKSDSSFMIKMNTSRKLSSPGTVKIIKHDKSNAKSINTSEIDHYDDLPFASRDQLQENVHEEDSNVGSETTCRKQDGEILTPRMRTKSEAMSDVVNRARYEQDRWRGTVKIQRDRVFHDHSILN